ncbi:MAG: ThiF family adenylyltransferase [Acidobacteria bacterium]|nr:ThiF family adenylyltransferase [Acidobacteriota bacterium]
MPAMLDQDNTLELFSRIKPIVGDALFNKQIMFVGDFKDPALMEYFVSCGVTKYSQLFVEQKLDSSKELFFSTAEKLSDRLELNIQTKIVSQAQEQDTDLIIATGDYQTYLLVKKLVVKYQKTAIFYLLINSSGLVFFLLPNRLTELPKSLFDEAFSQQDYDFLAKLHLNNIIANYAKGLLLAKTKYIREDIENIVNNHECLLVGHLSWPWTVQILEIEALPSLLRNLLVHKQTINSSSLRGKTCLIVGLGSLGSVVAENLAQLGANLILVDGETVEATNPIRQIYRLDQVAMPKVVACVKQLTNCLKINGDFDNEQKFFTYGKAISAENDSILALEQLIDKYSPDIAILATGTATDRIISQTLREKEIPQIIVSCYARARFFEAIVIANKTSPCFGCIRGHLYLGATPSFTPEQRARYVSSEHDLMAEPATRVETSRASDLATHLAWGLLNLAETSWLERALATDMTFFLGGNTSEKQKEQWVYDIKIPGEVKIFGLTDITGRGNYIECWDCGRKLDVVVEIS